MQKEYIKPKKRVIAKKFKKKDKKKINIFANKIRETNNISKEANKKTNE